MDELQKVQAELEALWAEQRAEDAVRLARREKLIALKRQRTQLEAMAQIARKRDALDAEEKDLFASAEAVKVKTHVFKSA